MKRIQKTLLLSKSYLMVFLIISTIIIFVDLGNIPFYIGLIWTLLVFFADYKNMCSEFKVKHLIFFLFIVSLLISCILNLNIVSSNSLVAVFVTFQYYYVLFLGDRDELISSKTIDIILNVCMIVFFIYSFINLVDFLFNLNWFEQDARMVRVSGIYKNPNTMGIMASIGLLVGLLLLKEQNIYYKIFAIANTLLQGYMIILSNCRSVIIALLIILLIVIINYLYKKFSRTTFFISTGVVLIAFIAIVAYVIYIRFVGKNIVIENYATLADFLNKLSANRFYLWKDCFTIFLSKPFFGIGPMNLLRYAPSVLSADSVLIAKSYDQTHQIFLSLLAYSGICGTGIFITWLITCLKSIFKSFKTMSFKSTIYCVIIFTIFCNALMDVAVLFDSRCWTLIFWLLLGYLVRLKEKVSQ